MSDTEAPPTSEDDAEENSDSAPDSAEDDAERASSDRARHSTELPAVVLGTRVGESMEGVVRVLPGRITPSLIFYPIYLLLVIAFGFAINVSLDTNEWGFVPVVITFAVLFLWNWLYVVTWEHQRTILKYTSAAMALGMEVVVALLCTDRAAPQLVANAQAELTDRAAIDRLDWVATILFACVVLLISHLLFFGRGYRAKRADPEEAPE